MSNEQSGRGLLGIRLGLANSLLGPIDINGGASSAGGLLGLPLPPAPASTQPLRHDEGPDLAAAGDLPCEGVCSEGGSYGTTAMYGVENRNLCRNCAVKRLGIEDEPEREKIRVLRPFLLPGR